MKRIKGIVLFLGILAFATGCSAEGENHRTTEVSGQQADQRPVNYPTGRAIKFSEEQVIKKEFQVTPGWQTIAFAKPLQINREGLMGLHLVVDKAPYISTTDTHPLNVDRGNMENAFSLRRLSDGALVKPEAFLIGDNGVEVRVRPDGHLYPSFDKHTMTVALRTYKDAKSPSPPFPVGIKAFTAMRIRGTEPFLVRYLWWSVDRHADILNR